MARILVIDDEVTVRDILVRMLEMLGHEVVTASNGQIGVQLYRVEPTDLVITDIRMSRKSGLDVIRELRQDNPDIKIITISGYGPEILDEAKQLGANFTFTKPLRMGTLVESVEESLEGDS